MVNEVSFITLPYEIQLMILSNLNLRDLHVAACVCRSLRFLSYDQSFNNPKKEFFLRKIKNLEPFLIPFKPEIFLKPIEPSNESYKKLLIELDDLAGNKLVEVLHGEFDSEVEGDWKRAIKKAIENEIEYTDYLILTSSKPLGKIDLSLVKEVLQKSTKSVVLKMEGLELNSNQIDDLIELYETGKIKTLIFSDNIVNDEDFEKLQGAIPIESNSL